MIRRVKLNKGLTLIELIVAMAVFAIVMTLAMSSIVGIFSANRKSRNLKTVLSNLNLTVESISKEMRHGRRYHCDSLSTGSVVAVQDCSAGGTRVGFLDTNGVQIIYRINGQSIEKQVGVATPINITAPEIIIDNLTFYVVGTTPSDIFQPKILMKIQSHAGTGGSRTDFTLQTLISQRRLDL